jgi:hypothetical protein
MEFIERITKNIQQKYEKLKGIFEENPIAGYLLLPFAIAAGLSFLFVLTITTLKVTGLIIRFILGI